MNWLFVLASIKIALAIPIEGFSGMGKEGNFATFFTGLFSYFKNYNENLFNELPTERRTILNSMPKLAFLLDIRVIVSLIGLFAVALYFFKLRKNGKLETLRTNIKPVVIALFLMKYTFSIIILILQPSFFFGCSNLLFGISMIHVFFTILDIIVVRYLLWKHKREDYSVYESPTTIIENTFAYIEHVFTTITSRKAILALAFSAILFILNKVVLKHNAYSKMQSNFIPTDSNNSIYSMLFCLFSAPHYSFTGFLPTIVDIILNFIIRLQIPLISGLVSLLSAPIKMLAVMALSAGFLFILKKIVLFFSKLTPKLVNFNLKKKEAPKPKGENWV